MIGLIDTLFRIDRYPGRAEKEQARLIVSFTVIMMVLFYIFAVFIGVGESGQPLFTQLRTDPSAWIPITGIVGVGIATLVLTRVGRADLASAGPVGMWYLSSVLIALRSHFIYSDAGASLILLVFFSGLFLRVRGLVIGLALGLITLILGALIYPGGEMNDATYISNTAGLAFQMLLVSILFYLFLRSTRLDQIDSTARAEDERFKLASVTRQIAQRISRRAALSDLLNSAVEDIQASYSDMYHVQIFLVDENTHHAVLAASTGEAGRTLIERGHSLLVGSQSVVGKVASEGEPVVARAGSPESIHRYNELLPETAVEAAFPLKIGEQVIGALDLQSRYHGAFAPDDVPIFQSLADNIAVAIDNARLFEQTEQRLQENRYLIEQMRGAVREVERLNRELTQQGWTQYLDGKSIPLGVEVDFASQQAQPVPEWTPTLDEAIQTNQLVQKPTSGGVIVSMPLRVRGIVVGAMEFEIEGETLAPEDADLVEAVAERFGLAVESTRLYEESRRVAHRETMLNEIGSRLQRTNSIDSVLAEAARGLQTSLGANRVAIRLGLPPKGGAA